MAPTGKTTEDVAILLTGSVTPAVNFVAVSDISERRRQYLAALHFYRDIAPVYFLENSSYDLDGDPDFVALKDIRLRKFAMRPEKVRGKGYQEFSMIDAWCESEPNPPTRFLKITGRYILRNVDGLLAECRRAPQRTLLVDRFHRSRIAPTSVFSASWEGYRQNLKELYQKMDDSTGAWAERIFFASLRDNSDARCFVHEPDLRGTSGSTGEVLSSQSWKWAARQALRRLNRVINPRILYFRR